jgi:hypothetical protein
MGLRVQNKLSNETQSLVSQCKVVVYDWTVKNLQLDSKNDAGLTKADALDVSSQVSSLSYTKTMGSPSGTFSFTLTNSPGYGSGDWKDLIKRGSWCLIYLSQDGDLVTTDRVSPPSKNAKKSQEAKKLRCIGFIDRVSVKAELNEKGAFDVVYDVSGRDFGVVYEDTSIWHNVFKYEKIMLESLATSSLNITGAVTIDKAIDLIHDLFFNPKAVPGAKVNDEHSLLSTALQWLMPRQMLQDLGLKVGSAPFWGEIPDIKNFSPTDANLSIERPTDYLSGNAWEQLKKLSVPQFHELFTETTDSGQPQLTFRPIPFAISKKNYPSIGKKVSFYKDLPIVEVPAIDVIDFNLGEDNHARYNSFLATVATSLIGVEDNIALLQNTGFPKNVQDSIKRYGFRPMHVTVDSIVKSAERADGKGNPEILKEFNWLLYDYWNNVVFAETGDCNLIGKNSIKIGKCLKFDDKTPYVFGKRYYIEGYTDHYVVDEKGTGTWTQSVSLTHGFEEVDLKTKSNFGQRNTPFNHEGEFTSAGSSTSGKNQK